MEHLIELTDAELDLVGGGEKKRRDDEGIFHFIEDLLDGDFAAAFDDLFD